MNHQPQGSATSQGPGWWLASDNKWYPPHLRAASPSGTGGVRPTGSATPTTGSAANPVQIPVDEPRSVPDRSAATPGLISTPTYGSTDRSASLNSRGAAASPGGTVLPAAGAGLAGRTRPGPELSFATTDSPQFSVGTRPAESTSVASSLPGITESTPAVDATPAANVPAGTLAILAGLAAMLGSFMEWATDRGISVDGFTLVRRVAAFDSSGWLTLMLGALLVVVGVMLVFGIKPMPLWSVLALLFGISVLVCVVWSYTDIVGQASDDWARFVARSTGLPDASIEALDIGLKASAGLWITGVGGLLGVLTAPFARRDQ